MKRFGYTLLLAALFSIAKADEVKIQIPALLTGRDADAIVKEQMRVAAQREKETLQSIMASRPLSTVLTDSGTAKTIMRRLPPKAWPMKPAFDQALEAGQWSEEQKAEWEASSTHDLTIMLSATVYDHKLSEIQWRKDGLEFTVLSNIDFNYLSSLGEMENGLTHWSCFFLVDNVDAELEQQAARRVAAEGEVYIPQPVPDGSMLDSGKADYAIYAEPGDQIPPELVEQMDALHQHFAANEQALKRTWLNRQELNKAHQAWQKANPPVPKKTVINFWPVRSRTNGRN